MKKVALVIVLLVLFAAVAGAAIPNDDKDFRAGLKFYNSKNYKAAVKHFREYINKRPDPTVYYLIGYSLYELGKFSEADQYFRDAYLIDPEYSLEKAGLIKKGSGEIAIKEPGLTKKPETAIEKKESKPPAQAAEIKTGKPVSKKPEPVAMPTQTASKATDPVPAPSTVQKPVMPSQSAPPQAVPIPPAPIAPAVPSMPMPGQLPDTAGPAALIAMVAALGMILVFIGIVFYAYYSLCLFFIAKKLGVSAPWTAWIPIVQVWTFVMSAGKPGWWVLLFLVPLVNLFVGIYLWMCITENLGKNKWLGLLILVPLAGIIYPGWLAFSKTEGSGGHTPPEETLTE